MGCDSFYYQAQNITIWTLGARYDTSRYIATGILSSRHISATYTQKVNEKINFSSEYTVQLSPDGGLETVNSFFIKKNLKYLGMDTWMGI